jgi:hypothetical protein
MSTSNPTRCNYKFKKSNVMYILRVDMTSSIAVFNNSRIYNFAYGKTKFEKLCEQKGSNMEILRSFRNSPATVPPPSCDGVGPLVRSHSEII